MSDITDEMVGTSIDAYWACTGNPSQKMRAALEAALPARRPDVEAALLEALKEAALELKDSDLRANGQKCLAQIRAAIALAEEQKP